MWVDSARGPVCWACAGNDRTGWPRPAEGMRPTGGGGLNGAVRCWRRWWTRVATPEGTTASDSMIPYADEACMDLVRVTKVPDADAQRAVQARWPSVADELAGEMV